MTLKKRPVQEPKQYQRRTEPRNGELSFKKDSEFFDMFTPSLPVRNFMKLGCLPSHARTHAHTLTCARTYVYLQNGGVVVCSMTYVRTYHDARVYGQNVGLGDQQVPSSVLADCAVEYRQP